MEKDNQMDEENKDEHFNENEDIDHLSEEELDEEDQQFIDDNMIDSEALEALAEHFEIQIVKGGDEMEIDEEEGEVHNYPKEYENFKADGEIYSIAMNEKGIVVMGDGENMTYFYDLGKKELIKKESFNKDSVIEVRFSHDYKFLAAASLDGSVNIFDGEEFKLLRTVNGSFSDINWLQWHPKGPVFAFGSVDGSVWVYHAQNTDTNMSFFGHTDSVSCGSFTSDGKYLISGSEDCSSKVWDLKNQVLLHTIKGKKYHQASICSLAVAKTKNIVATGSIENELALTNYDNANVLTVFKGGNPEFSIETIQFCNDDKFVMFAGTENNIQVLDLSTLQIRVKMNLNQESITKMITSDINNYFVYMSSSNGNFFVVDTRGNGSFSQQDKLHSNVLIDFTMTKDENFALTCSLDGTINLVKIIKL